MGKSDTATYDPKEICDNHMNASIGKAASPVWKLLLQGIAAGVFIALGAAAASTAAHAVDNVGLARLIMGAIFPVGLIMIVLLGAELFTGNALMVNAAIAKKIRWSGLLRNWLLVYLGNFIGAACVAALLAFFGHLDMGAKALAVYTAKVASTKASLEWFDAFVLGIFCNVLVCTAVYVGSSAKDTVGKMFGLYFPVFVFVIAGFEHCIANMYYIPAGIFANMNPDYIGLIEEAGINTEVLDFGAFALANLVPVTLGNIVGGALVGVFLYVSHATRGKK